MALVLFQESNVCPGALPRARPLHPARQAEEHTSLPARRGADYPFGLGILRLKRGSRRPSVPVPYERRTPARLCLRRPSASATGGIAAKTARPTSAAPTETSASRPTPARSVGVHPRSNPETPLTQSDFDLTGRLVYVFSPRQSLNGKFWLNSRKRRVH